jgi:hypothetical protein
MKWHSLNSGTSHEMYELSENEEKLLSLSYHPATSVVRIIQENEKRIFLLGREGFLRNRVVLRNEYGIRLSQVVRENNLENEGILTIKNLKYRFTIQKDLKNVLSLYDVVTDERIMRCEFPDLRAGSATNDILLLGLSWYLMQGVTA